MSRACEKYKYTEIRSIRRNCVPSQKIHIYGIMIDGRFHCRRSSEFRVQTVMDINVLDSRTDDVMKCIIYADEENNVKNYVHDGNIIRIHRIEVKESISDNTYYMSGRLNMCGLSVVIYSGVMGASYDCLYSSSKNFTLDEKYKSIIDSYREKWEEYRKKSLPLEFHAFECKESLKNRSDFEMDEFPVRVLSSVSRFEHFIRFSYHNVVAQIVSVMTSDRGNTVLRCWDTTKISCGPLHGNLLQLTDQMIQSTISIDKGTELLSKGFNYDIFLYGDHGQNARKVLLAGDIVLFTNVHYFVNPTSSSLVIHEGGAKFGRGFSILSNQLDIAQSLLSAIMEFKVKHVQSDAEANAVISSPKQIQMDSSASVSESRVSLAEIAKTFLRSKKEYRESRESLIDIVQFAGIVYAMKLESVNFCRVQQITAARLHYFIRKLIHHFAQSAPSVFELIKEISKSQLQVLFAKAFVNCICSHIAEALCERNRSDSAPMQLCNFLMNRYVWPMSISRFQEGDIFHTMGWEVSLTFNFASPMFSVHCNECQSFYTIRSEHAHECRICPSCFRNNYGAKFLVLNCFFPFSSKVDGFGDVYFLFSLFHMRLYCKDLPENPLKALDVWRNVINDEQKGKMVEDVKIQMLRRYAFAFDQLRMRKKSEEYIIFEVCKYTNWNIVGT